ncbi:MAG: response regulator transcription factor [Campylobacteraceae bacterium]|nr:response regulator transcription factor [Campylobacteraceae bacterium]
MIKDKFKNIKLLYVEDDDSLRQNSLPYFLRLFDKVYEASNVNEAVQIISKVKPLIVICDILLGSSSGLDMIRSIRRKNKDTQFIVLSAYTKKEYLLDAIDLGLVKYLSKPIKHETIFPLLLQCKNNFNLDSCEEKYLSETCVYNINTSELKNKNNIIKLTKNEKDFLHLLCERDSNIVTYEEIQNEIWYSSIMSDDAIRSLVRNLRRKLPKDCIQNISKTGYKVELL